MPSYPNPVAGKIQAYGEPWSGSGFQVTSPYGSRGGGFHIGMDLGEAATGEPVRAMAAGTVIERRPTPDGVVTIEAPDRSRIVYAHMTGYFPNIATHVAIGQVIGYVGTVGVPPDQPHLHVQVSSSGESWMDPWACLAQNQGDMRESTITVSLYPDGLRRWNAKGGKLTGWKPDGSTKTIELGAGSGASADATALIEQDPKIAPNGTFIRVVDGGFAGWYLIPAEIEGPFPNPDPAPAPDECSTEVQAERERWIEWLAERPNLGIAEWLDGAPG